MDKFLELIINFINENTPLLIIICVFLILFLIGYLIDNSIKTRKLERQMIDNPEDITFNEEPKKKEKDIPIEKTKDIVEEPKIDPNMEIDLDFRTPEEKKSSKPSIDPDMEIDLDFRTPEEKESSKPSIDPNMEIDLDFRTPEEKENKNEIPDIPIVPIEEEPKVTPIKPISNEVTVDPAINELLLRDFSNNGINKVDSSNDSIVPIDKIVTKQEEEKSIYKNDKKLSDIFKKKSSSAPSLEKTSDYTNELDKILKKLNEESNSKDSTLDETQDFTNMF